MPRLPGLSLADQQAQQGLSQEAHHSIARALGETLAELHGLTWPCVGAYDPARDDIQPLAQDYADSLVADVHRSLASCVRATTRTTPADSAWVEQVIAHAHNALQEPVEPCCVHGDYQESNVLVEESDGQWRVSGVFDLYPRFTDPEADLSRPLAAYLAATPAVAREFLRAYRAQHPLRAGVEKRFPHYMLCERMGMWEWAQREKRIWWDERLTLREWIVPFTSASDLF